MNYLPERVSFGEFSLDLRTRELRKYGDTCDLQEQPFLVLKALLEQPGQLVTREELIKRLWPADTFVDFEHSLNKAVKRLREALQDSPEEPKFIETLPRRGYRLIAPVVSNATKRTAVTARSSSFSQAGVMARNWNRFIGTVEEHVCPAPSPSLPKTFEEGTSRWRRVGLGTAFLILLVAAALLWQTGSRRAQVPTFEALPLLALEGKEASPAFSPDGNQVAFEEWGQPNTAGIYTTLIGGEKSLRLTDNPSDCCPTWSPDGRQIAFVRYSESMQEMGFYAVSALGGMEHKLYTGPANVRAGGGRIDWSPDGNFLAFSDPVDSGLTSRITLLSLSDFSKRELTSPPDQKYDCEPAFSPDGSSIAFARGSKGGNRRDLFVVRVSGGGSRQLTSGKASDFPAWTPDGKEIVFGSQLGGLPSLWRVSAAGGTARPVTGIGAPAFRPSISRKSNQLVYEHALASDAIWQLKLKDQIHPISAPARLISSRGINWRPGFSPDGKKIAFESTRLGYSDIWYCDSDGVICAELTSLHGTAGAPPGSPDGRFIAFEYQSVSYYQVYLVEVPGGKPQLLPTFPNADAGAPNWSHDGQWIYFYSQQENGPFQLWKVPFRGGVPTQVTANSGVHAAESKDGQFLYYSKVEQPGLWMAPLSGGEEKRILDQPPGWDWHSWGLTQRGIYYLDISDTSDPRIEFFDFSSRKSSFVFRLKPATSYHGLAVAPDGHSVLYVQNESADSFIMLVKHFQ